MVGSANGLEPPPTPAASASAWLPSAMAAANRASFTLYPSGTFISCSVSACAADAVSLSAVAAPSAAQAAPSRPQQKAPAAAPAPSVMMPPRPQSPPVDVQPAEFAPFQSADVAANMGNIDLIVDIPVRVTVELGRTRKMIGEVLALGPGSVVELNKMAGEPVDVLVNGKLIARGEVVVIDESFGIRVTEVVSRAERIRSMGV